MNTADKKVVRSDLWIDPVFDERLATQADISLKVFPVHGQTAAAWDMLSGAHVYHISAAKDELPKEWFASADLLARCPHLLCVSSSGAGLVGMGHIGTRVAAFGKAFGMEVMATDPLLTPEEITRRGAQPVSLNTLLEQSDVVSLHCPRDATTMKLIDAQAFATMKKGAIFISTARGGIHDEAALTAALQSGHLAGAGLDVWDQEPPPLDHPLLVARASVVIHSVS